MPGRLAHMLLNRRVPVRTRLGLLLTEARRWARPKPVYSPRYGRGRVLLSGSDYEIDWKTLAWVLADEVYATDYDGAVVLDIGAHKGYFGAYALAHGARTVISFEPETENARLLELSAASFRASGAHWLIRRTAVGAMKGETELHVMGGSWGHAINPPEAFAEYEVGIQRVTVDAMSDVLDDAVTLAGESPLVVKINVEGDECPLVLGTPASSWQHVSELFVEMHPWATCGDDELAAHVEAAGLRSVVGAHPRVLRLRREAEPRSGPRSAPR